MESHSKIFVAGGSGMVGLAIIRKLISSGYDNTVSNFHKRPLNTDAAPVRWVKLDLTRQSDTESFFEKERPEYVFLAAARVGGILANSSYPANFIYDNIAIATNIIHSCYRYGVKKLLNLGSSCIYPREAPQPLKEEYLLTGPLEPTNEAYAIAKIAAIKLCRYYNQEYGTNFMSVMPTNLYGPNDNFDMETSHVLPALIRKFHLGRLLSKGQFDLIKKDFLAHGNAEGDIGGRRVVVCQDSPVDDVLALLRHFGVYGSSQSPPIGESGSLSNPTPNTQHPTPNTVVELWGTGTPRREFLHVDDLADACVFILNQRDYPVLGEFVNLGIGEDISIQELSVLIQEITDYRGEVAYDTSKPDGMREKLLDVSRSEELAWKAKIGLKEGLRDTYNWYLRNSSQASND
jgi:GDP-L-fucose synthase